MIGLVYAREFAVRRRSFFFAVTFPGRGGFKSRCAFEDKAARISLWSIFAGLSPAGILC
ncbi:hypothetical protein [Paraburkholderia sp. J69-2]|uniref:hypothetical protein n=1 Tax=Paraburkholderia sp. J69-2 TaxID=2805437 RepID=UPI002AB06503|nr:hypothetical protein [Paraburkholderia sp. J69-2]